MSPYENDITKAYVVDNSEGIVNYKIHGGTYLYKYSYVRPVINLLKDKID